MEGGEVARSRDVVPCPCWSKVLKLPFQTASRNGELLSFISHLHLFVLKRRLRIGMGCCQFSKVVYCTLSGKLVDTHEKKNKGAKERQRYPEIKAKQLK